jgi:hypothetical protein
MRTTGEVLAQRCPVLPRISKLIVWFGPSSCDCLVGGPWLGHIGGKKLRRWQSTIDRSSQLTKPPRTATTKTILSKRRFERRFDWPRFFVLLHFVANDDETNRHRRRRRTFLPSCPPWCLHCEPKSVYQSECSRWVVWRSFFVGRVPID